MAEKLPDGFELIEEPEQTAELPQGFKTIDDPYEQYPIGDYSIGEIDAELERRGLIVPGFRKAPSVQALQNIGGDFDFKKAGKEILGIGEVAATMATGTIAEPVSGYTGIARTITQDADEAKKLIDEVQKSLTYIPKTEEGQKIAQNLGKLIEPVAKFLGKIPKFIGETTASVAGPTAGAAADSLVRILPDILGLEGSRMARKAGLERILKDVDASLILDEAGNINPKLKKAADVIDVPIEEVVNSSGIRNEINKIKTGKVEKIAEEILPNQEIIDAAKEFGVSENLLASHYSENPTFRAVEQGLKSVPGSALSAREKALMGDVAKRADSLIEEFGGSIDKAGLSDTFKFKSERIITDLENQAEKAYSKVEELIPKTTKVNPVNTISHLNKAAEEMGGIKNLSPKEKMLLKAFEDTENVTYALIDRKRKEIGQAMNKGSGPFKDLERGELSQLYKVLSEDQSSAARTISPDAEKLYDTARSLVATRKGIEDQLVKVIGKDLTGSITSKAKTALLNMSKGDTKNFDELLGNIPEQLGPDIRKNVIATSLNDAFTLGSRKEKSLNIPGFDDFMNGLNRNPAAKSRLVDEIGKEGMNRLDSFHKLVGGIRRAQQDAITTGRIVTVPKIFDEIDGITTKLYGAGKTVLPEVITSSAGMPGLATAMKLSMPKGIKRARSVAADELLASSQFRDSVEKFALGADQVKINKEIAKLPAYKKWSKNLLASEVSDLATVGILGFLTGSAKERFTEE